MKVVVPLAGIEPALLAELDFESSASTNSATGAKALRGPERLADYLRRGPTSTDPGIVAPRFRTAGQAPQTCLLWAIADSRIFARNWA